MNYKKLLSLLLIMPGFMIGMGNDKVALLKKELAIQESRINQAGPAMQVQMQIRIDAIKNELAQLESGAPATQQPAVVSTRVSSDAKVAALKKELAIHESRINQVGPPMRVQIQIRIDAIKGELARLESGAPVTQQPAVVSSAVVSSDAKVAALKKELAIHESRINQVGPPMRVQIQFRINAIKSELAHLESGAPVTQRPSVLQAVEQIKRELTALESVVNQVGPQMKRPIQNRIEQLKRALTQIEGLR